MDVHDRSAYARPALPAGLIHDAGLTRMRRTDVVPDRTAPRTRTIGVAIATALLLAILVPPATAREADPSRDDEARELVDSELLHEALRLIEERFVDRDAVDRETLTRGALRGLIDALGDDGHTVYLTPEQLEVEQDALEGRVTGIGVLVDRRAGQSVVISVVDGSPADLAGLRSGDVLLTVDGQELARQPEGGIDDLVRGQPGTTVRIGFERPGEPISRELTIVRREIDVPPVSWARVPGSSTVLLRIVQFSTDASDQTQRAVREALEAGADAFVIDLRGNPGGLVDEAVRVAGTFIDDGVAYRQRDRQDTVEDVPVRGPTLAGDIPLVVLVDYGTASSAEIVAASLHDSGRATIIGERTFGTGTILSTYTLSDGSALRLGTLEWLTPSGESVFGVGLTPDELVVLEPGAAALEPSDLVGMTASDVGASGDRPLERALDLLDG
jgi:carboxyl-terminal processing protease